MKASDLFVKSLENEGVEYIFGVAGEENLDLLESIRKSKKIKYVPTRHEQAAGFMAATVGRLTGKPGVCLSTLGPGATNLVTAIAYAKLGAFPMVAVTGQKPIKRNLQASFQILDIVNMMKPITEWTRSVQFASHVPSIVREAFRIAEEERPGPTHIELPKDIATEEVEAELYPVDKVRRPIAEIKAIERAVGMIEESKNPLIVIGAGANRKRTSKMLFEFIEKTKIPFIDTQMGKGVVDERHGLYLGTAALLQNDFVHEAIDKSDLVINIGHDSIEKPPFVMKHNNHKVIHINFFGAEVNTVYFPQLEVIGDIANTIWQIKEKITPKNWSIEEFLNIKAQMQKSIDKIETIYSEGEIKPQEIVHSIREALGVEDILALDNGMYKLWFARGYKVYNPNTLLLDNALATMGAGLPSAIAAKLINPNQKVVCVAGDGGFMMSSQELETLKRLNLDLVIIILNDNQLGMINWEQKLKGFAEFGLKHSNPDFVKLAEAFGINGHRVETIKDFEMILNSSLDGGIHLIEVPIDYSENKKFTKILEKSH